MIAVNQVFALLCVIACAASAPSQNCASKGLSSRIIEGKNATPGAYPYMASLRSKDSNGHFCGGSIINEHWILTAAHCVVQKDSEAIIVVVGSNKLNSGGKAYAASFITYHENYSPNYIVNDIGLIKVSELIEFGDLVQPLSLADADIDENNYPATVSGWGRFDKNTYQASNDLQYYTTCLLRHETCLEEIGSELLVQGQQKICLFTHFGQGVCHGDSGSPMVADNVQIGIASYITSTCASGTPDVFTKVYPFLDWINRTIEAN